MSKHGREYFLMALAHELKMTRRQLLANIDSYELTMWKVYFDVMNQPPQKKQSPKEIQEIFRSLPPVKQGKGVKNA